MGKNMKFDKGAFDRMTKQSENKTKIAERAARRSEQIKKAKHDEIQEALQRKRDQLEWEKQFSVTSTTDPNHLVFKVIGEESPEKSFITPDLAKMIAEEDAAKEKLANEKTQKKKKKKKK